MTERYVRRVPVTERESRPRRMSLFWLRSGDMRDYICIERREGGSRRQCRVRYRKHWRAYILLYTLAASQENLSWSSGTWLMVIMWDHVGCDHN